MSTTLQIAPFSPQLVPSGDRDTAKAMLAAIERGVEARIEAGKHWLKLSNEAQAAIYEKTPVGFRPFWERLSRIGRGEMHPLLFDLTGRAASYLTQLPISDQAAYLTEGVPVLRDNQLVMADPSSLSSAEVSQVFEANGKGVRVRTYQAQRRLRNNREKEEKARMLKVARKKRGFKIERKGKWRITGDRAKILPQKNSEGLTLEDVNALAVDMRQLYRV